MGVTSTMLILLSIAVLLPIAAGSKVYTYKIDKTLNGSAISHDPFIISLSNVNGTFLKIGIQGEILESPGNPENCRNGFGHENLLEFEVVVLYLLDLLDIDYTASIFEGIWTGEALVQSAYLPSN